MEKEDVKNLKDTFKRIFYLQYGFCLLSISALFLMHIIDPSVFYGGLTATIIMGIILIYSSLRGLK